MKLARRDMFALPLVLPLLASGSPAQARTRTRTFVLVHGAWHGGWCWRLLQDQLVQAGHRVFAPTLTGLGERAHQAGPNVNLSLHFQDIAQLLECEELEDVTLVGHSFGGKVIAGAASLVPQRVERLVYLDAHLATPGEAAVPDIRAAFGLAADRPVPATIAPIGDARMMGVTDPKQAAWVNRRMTPHPAGCFTQAYPADRVPPDRPRLYIRCRHDADEPPNVLTPFLQRVKSEPGWTLADLPTGHDAMVTMPVELASVLQGFG